MTPQKRVFKVTIHHRGKKSWPLHEFYAVLARDDVEARAIAVELFKKNKAGNVKDILYCDIEGQMLIDAAA